MHDNHHARGQDEHQGDHSPIFEDDLLVDQMIVVYDKNMSYRASLLLENKIEKYLKNKKIISPNDNRGIYLSNTGEEQENSRKCANVLNIIISFIKGSSSKASLSLLH